MRQPFLRALSTSLVVLLLAGCGAGQPTATPAAPTATQQVVSFTTPIPTATRPPTETPTTTATFTATPAPTDTSTPAPTDTSTSAPPNTSTPTVQPPTNTPLPPTNTPPPAEPTVTPPPPNPAPAAANGRNFKKGVSLAYPNCEDVDTLQVSWYFNNDVQPKCTSPTTPFIPRVYDAKQATDSYALGLAIEHARNSGWLLGFVEPNLPWHGNVSPEDGARAWRAIEEAALPHGIKLVAPSPSQHAPNTKILPEYDPDPYGYTWLWAMVQAYQNLYGQKPHFDALAWNFYEGNPDTTKAYLSARHQEAVALGYDLPFWVMEYAGRCWDTGKYPTGNEQIMGQVTPWLNETPWIGRYAWFSNRIRGDEAWGPNHHSCSLINPDNGQPTALGQSYLGY